MTKASNLFAKSFTTSFTMIRIFTLLGASVLLFHSLVCAATDGPDAFGYTWIDSEEVDGPEFLQIEPGLRATELLSADDSSVVFEEVTLARPFVFYGEVYPTLYVSKFGYLTTDPLAVSDATPDCPLPQVPDSGADAPRIYAMHGDLDFAPGGSVHYEYLQDLGRTDIPGGGHVFTWSGIVVAESSESFSFQAILADSFDILIQSVATAPGGTGGFSGTTGIQQSSTGGGLAAPIGGDCGANTSPMAFARAVHFRPPVVEVTTLEDQEDNPVGAEMSLREALRDAPAGSAIRLAPELSGEILALTQEAPLTIARPLSLVGPVTIDGLGATAGIIANATGALSCVILEDCLGAGISITAGADCALHFVDVEDTRGTGLVVSGAATLEACYLSANLNRTGSAGGLSLEDGATAVVYNSTFGRNLAGGLGGGLRAAVGSTLELIGCTFSGNVAGLGGGGVFAVGASVSVSHCTFAGNSSFDGVAGLAAIGAVVTHTIFQGNQTSGNLSSLSSSNVSLGYNITDDAGFSEPLSSDLPYCVANLGPLVFASVDSSRGTPIHPPLAGSPAIAGGQPGLPLPLRTDGRGAPRIAGAQIDIGAFETSPPLFVTNTADRGVGSLRETIATAPPGATIQFAETLGGATIELASEIPIDKTLVIDATGTNPGVTLSGDGTIRLFRATAEAHLSLFGLELSGGSGQGGALLQESGNAAIAYSLITGNFNAVAALGEQLLLSNCTFSGNRSAASGAALTSGSGTVLLVDFCTFAENSSDTSGASAILLGEGSRFVGFRCLILEGIDASSLSQQFVSIGGNVTSMVSSQGFDAPADRTNVNVTLAPLSDNGGRSRTHALIADSDLVDSLDFRIESRFPAYDQRGYPRNIAVLGTTSDTGAFELDAGLPSIINIRRLFSTPLLELSAPLGIDDHLTFSTDLVTWQLPDTLRKGSAFIPLRPFAQGALFYRIERNSTP